MKWPNLLGELTSEHMFGIVLGVKMSYPEASGNGLTAALSILLCARATTMDSVMGRLLR